MKVAIIGCGQIASIHGPLILNQPDAELVAVADPDLERAKALATRLNKCRSYDDAGLMIGEEQPDVVHVLVPPHDHAQMSTMAMDEGCHVLVEKPMASAWGDAQIMFDCAKRNNVKLCVDHSKIYEEVVQRAIALIREGAIGELVSVEAHDRYDARRNPALIEEGAELCHWSYRLNGGPLEDLMPHVAAFIFEFIPEIKEVGIVGQNRGILPKGWQDEIRVLINSEKITGYISISLAEKPDATLFTAKGTRGIVVADLFSNLLLVQKRSSLPRALDRGYSGFQLAYQHLRESVRNTYRYATGRVDKTGGIGTVICKFYQSLRDGTETPIALEKGLKVVELMNKIWPDRITNKETLGVSPYCSKSKRTAPTALVTGASGFIGTHLIKRLLSENVDVRALVRRNSIHLGRLKKLDVEIVEGDVTDGAVVNRAVQGITSIYHAAATMSKDWEEHRQTNIRGTSILLQAAQAHKIHRFVYLSTLAVYDLLSVNNKNRSIVEDSEYQRHPEAMGPYAYSKIAAEKLVFDAYRTLGLPVVVLRPGIVVGPLGRVFFPHLGYRYQDKAFFIVGEGSNRLPLTYVENTVDGIYRASIEEEAVGQAYNLVDDGEITIREYLKLFTQVSGIPVRVIALPYTIPYLATATYEAGAFCGFLRKGVTSRAQLKWKQVVTHFENTKAKTDLGWRQKVPLQEGLARTFEWYAQRYR